MAVTQITDVIDPEILANMILLKLPNNTILIPGVFTTTDFPIGTKGTIWEIPFNENLPGFETYKSGTDLTPQSLGQGVYRMPVIRKAAVYSTDKIVEIAAFKDPQDFIATQLSTQTIPDQYMDTQILILEGAIPPANRYTGASGGTDMSAANVRVAKLKLGDKARNLKHILMHSKQFGDLEAAGEVVYVPKPSVLPVYGTQLVDVGAPAPNAQAMIPTVAGLVIYQSDNCPLLGSSPETYVAYILGDKAMGHFWQQRLNIDLDRDVIAKEDLISPDFDYVMTLHGVDYTSTDYDDTDINDTTNYTLKWDQKLVQAVRLVTT